MSAEIFNEFVFRAKHALPARSPEAAVKHWHRYTVEFWFTGEHDQDKLTSHIETIFYHLHGANLSAVMDDSSDEGLAQWLLRTAREFIPTCTRVVVKNDDRRGAVAT